MENRCLSKEALHGGDVREASPMIGEEVLSDDILDGRGQQRTDGGRRTQRVQNLPEVRVAEKTALRVERKRLLNLNVKTRNCGFL